MADLQALNRYSYVQNNPLSYTDPSGYFLKKLVKGIGRAIGKVLDGVGHAIKVVLQKIGRVFGEVPGLAAAIGAMGCAMMPAACLAIQKGMLALSTAITAANGGTISQILSELATGAIAYGVPGGGGFWSGGLTAKIAEATKSSFGALVFMGGAMAKAQGGKFIDGVKGAAIGYGVGRIIAASRSKSQYTKNIQEAIDYISQSKAGRALVTDFEATGFAIVEGIDPYFGTSNTFNEKYGIVYWDPNVAMDFEAGIGSPAMTLAHEMSHAVRFYQNPVQFLLEQKAPPGRETPSGSFSFKPSLGEIRATNHQNVIGSQLGEPFRNGYRDDKIAPSRGVTWSCIKAKGTCLE